MNYIFNSIRKRCLIDFKNTISPTKYQKRSVQTIFIFRKWSFLDNNLLIFCNRLIGKDAKSKISMSISSICFRNQPINNLIKYGKTIYMSNMQTTYNLFIYIYMCIYLSVAILAQAIFRVLRCASGF